MRYTAHDILMGMGEARRALGAAKESLLDRLKAGGWYGGVDRYDPDDLPDMFPRNQQDATSWEAELEWLAVRQAKAELARWKRRARAYHAFILKCQSEAAA